MKKKSFIVVFIVTLIIIFLLFPKTKTPFSGTYHAGSSNAEELILNSDNSFDLRIDNYRNSLSIHGKYKISNNHITLISNNKDDMFFIQDIKSGEINGSVITFKQTEKTPPILFTKSWLSIIKNRDQRSKICR